MTTSPINSTKPKIDALGCLQKMKLAGTLSLASVDEEGAPQIRLVSAVHYEDDAVFFFTARGKEMARQLQRDGRLQTVVHTRFNEMIRMSGTAIEASADQQRALIDTIFSEQPYLGNVYPGDTRYTAGLIFKIEDISLDYFNLGVHPIERYQFALSAEPKPKGYVITDDCIGCGTCVDNCPQSCIEELDGVMHIQSSHCLHCGNCFSVCPVSAVERL